MFNFENHNFVLIFSPNLRGDSPDIRGDSPKTRGHSPKIRGKSPNIRGYPLKHRETRIPYIDHSFDC